ncbi:uncharacterized protein LOC143255845 [Tachypleus tridentatus]|uniref:uncharacterized protein LOC143255845 n=1 Tax=Tachypleus tridentatus TaxID=6853 RepID=UPI003FD385E2
MKCLEVLHLSLLYALFLLLKFSILCHAVSRTNKFGVVAPNNTCYFCSTIFDGESCLTLPTNVSRSLQRVCGPDEMFCTVLRIDYGPTGEDASFWSIERNCTNHCQEGCVVLGEKTKLYHCRSCCHGNLCNSGDHAPPIALPSHYLIYVLFAIAVVSI